MTDYPRCATCKHWSDDTLCSPGYRNCDAVGERGTLAVIGPDGADSLQTAPEFGCVLHEPKAGG